VVGDRKKHDRTKERGTKRIKKEKVQVNNSKTPTCKKQGNIL
jgi:hypothetical protein